MPKGSWFEMEAHFDNSDSNPANPNKPAKLVRWGERTDDEMCIGIYEWVAVPGDAEPRSKRRAPGRVKDTACFAQSRRSGETPHEAAGNRLKLDTRHESNDDRG